MINPKQIWAFDEPGPYGGNAHITMTEEEIIKHMSSREEYKNSTDAHLLDQFIVVNWAYKEDPPKKTTNFK